MSTHKLPSSLLVPGKLIVTKQYSIAMYRYEPGKNIVEHSVKRNLLVRNSVMTMLVISNVPGRHPSPTIPTMFGCELVVLADNCLGYMYLDDELFKQEVFDVL